MNNGNKIITILGIAAAVIFIGTLLVSMSVHYSTKKHHEARFKELCTIAEIGRPYDKVNADLQNAGFTIHDLDLFASGGRSVTYTWDEQKRDKRFQQKKLGVPIAARLRFDQDDRLTACDGLMILPGGEE